MTSLIASENAWALWAILLGAAAFGLWAERRPWGRKLSGAVLAIGATFVLSNLGIVPIEAPVYDAVWEYFVPLAIPLLLFRADLRKIVAESGPTLLAFGLGAIGTILGTLLAFRIVPLGPEGAKLAGIFCATYIGGSLNYVASAEALGLRSGDLLAAGVAADNLVMTLYFLVLFALPSISALRRLFARRHEDGESSGDEAVASDATPFRPREILVALTLAAALCAAGYAIARALGYGSLAILFVTALAVAAATLSGGRTAALAGASETGALLMMVFFATIGTSANVRVVLAAGPWLFVLAVVILAVHLATVLLGGKLLGLDLAEIVIASNANIGGPTTAAAMASARGWPALVTPAILCGALGYATATFLGVFVGGVLGAFR